MDAGECIVKIQPRAEQKVPNIFFQRAPIIGSPKHFLQGLETIGLSKGIPVCRVHVKDPTNTPAT